MTVTVAWFEASLSRSRPPAELDPCLRALWFDARGDWQAAHESVASDVTPAGCGIHGYLHRKEGDLGNAAYWYRRAGMPVAHGPLDAERAALLRHLLDPGTG